MRLKALLDLSAALEMMMRKFLGRLFAPIVRQYLSKERTFVYGEIKLKILPDVFHPGFFFSTKFMVSEIEKENLYKKNLLELGAGSGLISFVAEKLGAYVTATDISDPALEGLRINKENLKSNVSIIQSDLFDQVPAEHFDFVIINPPYFPRNQETDSQLAWYCGEHHDFFEKLFLQLREREKPILRIIMVLSEDCDILTIRKLAEKNNFHLIEKKRKKFWGEWNFIFEVK